MNNGTTHRRRHQRDRQRAGRIDSLTTTLRTDYWVIDERGRLPDPDLVAGLPGAEGTDSPYSVAVETPSCEDCGELRRALTTRLRSTVAAAHERGCRLLALGIRPDRLAEGLDSWTDQPPPAATAGTRVVFEPEPAAAADCYNTLLALDPAFALLNTACRADGDRRDACGRPSLRHRGPPAPYRSADTAAARLGPAGDDGWQPVTWLDGGSTIEWRSLDATTPTLLVDLLADLTAILQEAARCRVTVASFGNGFHGDRLVLPDETWRAIYTEAAIREGVSSLLVRAYLERFGIETGWYRAASQPVCEGSVTDCRALCRRLATDLETDLGIPPLD